MKHEGQLVIPAVNRLEVMPYWPMYADWIDHLNECAQCGTVMVSGDQMISGLCPEGQTRQQDLQHDLMAQSSMAALN